MNHTRWSPLVLALLVLIGLGACVPAQQSGRPFNLEARKEIKVNVTTKGEVARLLGEPVSRSLESTRERWIYHHVRTTGAVNPICVLTFGLCELFGAEKASVQSDPSRSLTVSFQTDIVVACSYV